MGFLSQILLGDLQEAEKLREITAKIIMQMRVLRSKSVLEAALRSVSRCVQEQLSGCTEPVSMDVQRGAQDIETAMQYSTVLNQSHSQKPSFSEPYGMCRNIFNSINE